MPEANLVIPNFKASAEWLIYKNKWVAQNGLLTKDFGIGQN
jgi:hypothetical protein